MKCAYCTRKAVSSMMDVPLCSECLHAFIAISKELVPVCRDCVTMKKYKGGNLAMDVIKIKTILKNGEVKELYVSIKDFELLIQDLDGDALEFETTEGQIVLIGTDKIIFITSDISINLKWDSVFVKSNIAYFRTSSGTVRINLLTEPDNKEEEGTI